MQNFIVFEIICPMWYYIYVKKIICCNFATFQLIYCCLLYTSPFRNLFNDFYARDTSKKIRAVMRSKGNAGEHLCTNPPYGYRKYPDDKKKWIVDEEAAAVVKKIFDLCIAGKGPMQIAKALTADKVLTVKAYYAKRDGKAMPDNLYRWDYKSIAGILERPEYTGCTVNFKTYSKSHKLKKRLQNAPENYRIFPNTQDVYKRQVNGRTDGQPRPFGAAGGAGSACGGDGTGGGKRVLFNAYHFRS